MELPHTLIHKSFIEQHVDCTIGERAAEKNYPRILCCIPSYTAVVPQVCIRLMILAQESGKAEAAGRWAMRFNVAGPKIRIRAARESAATFAMNGNATHLLFIDDDMLVIPGMVDALLKHNADIIAPLFFADNRRPLAFGLDDKSKPIPIWKHPDQLFESPGGVGTGVMLIKREVLDAMEPPYFLTPGPDPTFGEDIEFCRRARELGFRIWCDPTIVVDQMGPAAPVPRGD